MTSGHDQPSQVRILFVRHGESTANRAHICAGQTDSELTDVGRSQAIVAGRQILEQGEAIDTIISSPLARALVTAELIADVISYPRDAIITTPLATERPRGTLEGKPSSLQIGLTNDGYIAQGAESEESMTERIKQLLDYIQAEFHGTVLLVSHNVFGKSLLACKNGAAYTELDKIPNASVFEL